MFPAGAAGWGLLLLRVCAAGMLVRGAADATVPIHIWEMAGLGILAGAFCLWRIYSNQLQPLCSDTGSYAGAGSRVRSVSICFLLLHHRRSFPLGTGSILG